jgi:hypothetical protein
MRPSVEEAGRLPARMLPPVQKAARPSARTREPVENSRTPPYERTRQYPKPADPPHDHIRRCKKPPAPPHDLFRHWKRPTDLAHNRISLFAYPPEPGPGCNRRSSCWDRLPSGGARFYAVHTPSNRTEVCRSASFPRNRRRKVPRHFPGIIAKSRSGSGSLPLGLKAPDPSSAVAEPLLSPLPGSVRIVPNPGTDQSLVRFTLNRAIAVAVEVFDASGARVRVLAGGLWEAGEQSVAWNGRGDEGRELPAGVYFVRATTPQKATTGRAVVARYDARTPTPSWESAGSGRVSDDQKPTRRLSPSGRSPRAPPGCEDRAS